MKYQVISIDNTIAEPFHCAFAVTLSPLDDGPEVTAAVTYSRVTGRLAIDSVMTADYERAQFALASRATEAQAEALLGKEVLEHALKTMSEVEGPGLHLYVN